jgi:hypothetical protein
MEKFRFCFNNFGTHQNVLVLFQSFRISSAFVIKNSGTHQNVMVLFQSFWIKWKSSAFVLTIFETHQNIFGFVTILSSDIGKSVLLFRYR